MKKKVVVILLALAFVGLFGCAYVLYNQLSQAQSPELLAPPPSFPETTVTPNLSSPEEESPSKAPESSGIEEDPEDAPQTTAPPVRQEPKAPNFTVYDAEGNAVLLSDYLGKPIVLNFWASWCSPCKNEMPDFQAQYEALGNEVQFLMINMTGGRETLSTTKNFIAQQGYTFPVFYDTFYSAADAYTVTLLPTTYFIDSEGYVIAYVTGAINATTLQEGIDRITK